jgi:hypothetical protein
MVPSKVSRTYYSESEAAVTLGITVDQLRGLILDHILEREEDLKNMPLASLHPSDLLVLKLLAGLGSTAAAAR